MDKETGNFARVVQSKGNEDLIVSVKKKGLAFSSKYVNTKSEERVVEAPLEVQELEVGKEYKLNDINFPTNSYELDYVSRSVIDEFIIYLEENPELKADIQGHTDNQGEGQDNRSLSQNRAQVVYNYFSRARYKPGPSLAPWLWRKPTYCH
ncbi:MAG: OmpA family protein [Owenweeksia sp.]|nr:OmpA family protein [Owenweeksia sp.]